MAIRVNTDREFDLPNKNDGTTKSYYQQEKTLIFP